MKTKELVKAFKICPYKDEQPPEKAHEQYCKKYNCLCFEFVRSGKCERMKRIINEYFESGK